MQSFGTYQQQEDNIEDPGVSEEGEEPFFDFALPNESYWDMTFARRVDPQGSSSPPSLSHQFSSAPAVAGKMVRRYSTVDDTDGISTHSLKQRFLLIYVSEPRSSPASTRGTPSGRNKRASKGTRSSRLAEVSLPGRRRASKAAVNKATDKEENDEEDHDDSMDIDEDEDRATPLKDKSKASKGARKKVSTRRSERNR